MSDLKPRIDYAKVARSGYEAMRALETYILQSGLEPAGAGELPS
jgi:hypothetical protein